MLSYKKASRRTSCWIKFASCSLPPTKPPDPLAARNKLFDSLPHSAVSKPRRRKTCVPLLEFFGNPTHTCHTHRANVQSRETTPPPAPAHVRCWRSRRKGYMPAFGRRRVQGVTYSRTARENWV